MPNPIISPVVWAPVVPFTVSDSPYAAFDIHMSSLDESAGMVILAVPAGATVAAIRNPADWSGAGTPILSGGAWVPATALGDWSLTVTSGADVTDPATLSISSFTSGAGGLLRLVVTGLSGDVSVEPAGGELAIDRVLAVPTILNAQTNPPAPIREHTDVTVSASVSHSVTANPAPSQPLPALPAVVSAWAPDPGNPLALPSFASAGASGTFSAPAVYEATGLDFVLTAALDLDATGIIDASDPANTATLAVVIEQARYGMVLVLDRSGSMGSSLGGGMSKWNASVRAAHAWADLFRAFRPGDDHLAGIVTFENDSCGWTPSAADDVTFRNPASGAAVPGATPLQPLSSTGTVTTWNLGTPQSCTPIGDGLIKAWDALGAQLVPDDRATVVLMTDGYENAGSVTIAASAVGPVTTFDQKRKDDLHKTANDIIGERLFTLALGTQVDDDRLNTLGSGYYQQITTSVNEVTPAFAAMLGHTLHAETLMPQAPLAPDPDAPPDALYYRVSTGERRLAFLAHWENATDALRIGWRPQGSSDPFTLVAAGGAVSESKRSSHGLTGIDLAQLVGEGSPATEWRLQHVNAANTPQPINPDNALAMVDLVTKVDVGFDKPQYFIGEPIGLTVRIASGGVPVTGATVQYDAARPGESLGTYLTRNAPIYKRSTAEPSGQGIAAPSVRDTAPPDTAPPRQDADPPKGKGLMVKALFAADGDRENLGFVTVAGQPLFDDGAHGDGVADDGVYGAAYTDTAKEGTYTFRFRIEGKLADGSAFSRVFVRSTWVGVRPDPNHLGAVWTLISPQGAEVAQSLLTITPQTASGEFLGPFRGDEIDLKIFGGTAVGPLVDGIDGSYSIKINHPPGRDPTVGISIYGQEMAPASPGSGAGGWICCCWPFSIKRCLACLRHLLRRLFGR
ncbi:choice-of-anchor X domain-containing protein [Pseudochelatococcus sp. B33]